MTQDVQGKAYKSVFGGEVKFTNAQKGNSTVEAVIP
jgi:hypothetical protein